MNRIKMTLMTACCALTLGACAAKGPEMKTVHYVDLDRFMGRWYVIANIPTALEKGAHNAVETYELDDDGTIDTTFTFRKGGFDGEEKRYNPRGFVKDNDSNALWGMQFIWPIKADYRIVYLSEDYEQTIIGRQKRDFIWIMARTPNVSDEDFEKLIGFSETIGYDISKIEKVPQQWPEPR